MASLTDFVFTTDPEIRSYMFAINNTYSNDRSIRRTRAVTECMELWSTFTCFFHENNQTNRFNRLLRLLDEDLKACPVLREVFLRHLPTPPLTPAIAPPPTVAPDAPSKDYSSVARNLFP